MKGSEGMGWRREERVRTIAGAGLAALVLSAPAFAETQLFFEKAEWEAAVGDYTTIDFTGFEDGEPLSDQYADLGVTAATSNAAFRRAPSIFPSDWWGVSSTFGPGINLAFDTPQRWIAADYPGAVAFRLFMDDVFLDEVQFFGGGTGFFGGLVFDHEFNRVEMVDVTDGIVSVDNLYFGVPAPGAIGLLTLTLLVGPPRRRGD